MRRCDYGRDQRCGDGAGWADEGCRVASVFFQGRRAATETLRVTTFPLRAFSGGLLECQKSKGKGAGPVKQHFKEGRVTIIDLTDPFINTSAASALFDIALSLYLETSIPSGKLLVLDEAHKVSL